MIISVNWLKKFTDIDLSIDELAELIGERLVEIEEVINLGEKYQDIIVAKVVESARLEGSDHLNVVKIDDGGVVKDVERDESGLVQVVCGASNVRAGLAVAWLPPKSVVPETFHSPEPFVLGAKPLRGVMSNGMLASARELDLYDDHDGILEVDKEAAPGSSFAELYELNDYLLDIENKSLTHRPDAFGVVGFAREVAGIQGREFKTPDWLSALAPAISNDGSADAPAIEIEDSQLSDRFAAIILSGIDETAHSPVQIQTYLARSGVRPISASVDVSNYLMLLTGQPSHTYDYDKLKAIAGDDFTIRVRRAAQGEKLTLLDGKEVTLDESDIVIAGGEVAIGLAGIMGGASTKVDKTTKSVILELATFNLYNMRASQMRHGIFSEAVTRFTKGIPAPLAAPVGAEAARLLAEFTGAKATSPLIDEYPNAREPIVVAVTQKHINDTLGTYYSVSDIAELLENVGFKVTFEELEAKVTVPYWREDIHIPEDIIEEVGRLAGYDTIHATLPRRDFVATRPSQFDALRSQLRARFVRAGANEVLTYSFVHGDLLRKAGQNPEGAYRVVNSISPDLQYYRMSLMPSLLNAVNANSRAGYESFALFECNKVHRKDDGLTDENVPVEVDSIALTLADSNNGEGAYYQAKALLEYALEGIGVHLKYEPLASPGVTELVFEQKRSAVVVDAKSGVRIGAIGEYKRSVKKAFKLPEYSAGFEIDPRAILELVKDGASTYRPLSRFPGSERDVCFQVAHSVAYERITMAARAALEATDFIFSIEPLDVYQADGSTTKNITIRIHIASYEKTMTAEEVTEVIETVIKDVISVTDGKVI